MKHDVINPEERILLVDAHKANNPPRPVRTIAPMGGRRFWIARSSPLTSRLKSSALSIDKPAIFLGADIQHCSAAGFTFSRGLPRGGTLVGGAQRGKYPCLTILSMSVDDTCGGPDHRCQQCQTTTTLHPSINGRECRSDNHHSHRALAHQKFHADRQLRTEPTRTIGGLG